MRWPLRMWNDMFIARTTLRREHLKKWLLSRLLLLLWHVATPEANAFGRKALATLRNRSI